MGWCRISCAVYVRPIPWCLHSLLRTHPSDNENPMSLYTDEMSSQEVAILFGCIHSNSDKDKSLKGYPGQELFHHHTEDMFTNLTKETLQGTAPMYIDQFFPFWKVKKDLSYNFLQHSNEAETSMLVVFQSTSRPLHSWISLYLLKQDHNRGSSHHCIIHRTLCSPDSLIVVTYPTDQSTSLVTGSCKLYPV